SGAPPGQFPRETNRARRPGSLFSARPRRPLGTIAMNDRDLSPTALCERYEGAVRRIAKWYIGRAPAEDLHQAGREGVLEAWRRYYLSSEPLPETPLEK